MSYRFTVGVPLRWVDVDSKGVVNNAVYLHLVEEARFQYFGRLGLLPAGNVEFVLAEAVLRFVRPGRLGMATEVSARTVRLGRTSCSMEYEIRGDGEVLVRSSAVLVFVGEDGRPRPLTDAERAAIGDFEGIPISAGDP
ncbi:MAG: thioesterase family protein [Planctomycetota bacterium]